MNNNKKNCVLYIRVSKQEQAKKGLSLQAQKEHLINFSKIKGWNITNIYQDPGHSGSNFERPGIKALLNDMKQKKYNIILIYKLDRLSRNLRELLNLLYELNKEGINIASSTEPIDTTTAMGKAFFQMMGLFAELERELTKERVIDIQEKKIREGKPLGKNPLGYRYIKRKKGKELVIDLKKGLIIKEVFEMWAKGINHKKISEETNIKTSTLYNLIRNPIYKGYISFKGKTIKGKHEPIISEELWEQVQEKLQRKK